MVTVLCINLNFILYIIRSYIFFRIHYSAMPLVTHAVTLLFCREGVSLFTLLQSHWYGYMYLPLTEMRPSASRFTIGTYGKMSYTSWRVLMEASIPRWPLLGNLQWPTQRNLLPLINSTAGNSSLFCGEETSWASMHNMTVVQANTWLRWWEDVGSAPKLLLATVADGIVYASMALAQARQLLLMPQIW